MSEERPNNRQLLHQIAMLSAEAAWSDEETSESLRDVGINPDEIADRVVHQVRRLTRESPLHWRNRAQARRFELLQQMKERMSVEFARLSRAELLHNIENAIQRLSDTGAAQSYAVAFRKFEGASDDDLRSMLEELTVLEELGTDEDNY